MRTRALIAGTAVAFVVAAVPSAFAAGVGGVEVTPPNGTSFRVEASEGGTETQPFTLSNIRDATATVRLYGAAASRASDGTWSAGAAGSAPWLGLDDQEVTLAAGESREMTFTVRGEGAERTGAVVVEQGSGTVLVQRAATLVYVTVGAPLPIPLLLLGVAVLLVALGVAGWVVLTRQRRAVKELQPAV